MEIEVLRIHGMVVVDELEVLDDVANKGDEFQVEPLRLPIKFSIKKFDERTAFIVPFPCPVVSELLDPEPADEPGDDEGEIEPVIEPAFDIL